MLHATVFELHGVTSLLKSSSVQWQCILMMTAIVMSSVLHTVLAAMAAHATLAYESMMTKAGSHHIC